MKDIQRIVTTIEKLERDELKDFLIGILSPQEIKQLTKRLEIIRLLKQGLPQHEIASRLNVGITTVSRGAKMLNEGRFKYLNWG
jgi:TrpR family trp operon transcriptional repressor